MKRTLLATLLVTGVTACTRQTEPVLQISTAAAGYSNITVMAEATGKIEPINIIDIKSKAGGQIIEMPVETGTRVEAGDLIVELDKRDVESQYQQALADLEAANERVKNAEINKARNDTLYQAGIITKQSWETSGLDLINAKSAQIRAQQAIELAQVRRDDATIRAPSGGIILEKIVSEGTVIASASSSASGGTTLVRMADLSSVRAKVLVTETDIGKVREGLEASVLVDAYPGRVFRGTVEKIEPIAVVEQNVTMFPVLVLLPNEDGALKPGMNGEVGILVDERDNVLSVPPDAIRALQQAAQVAPQFGLTADSVNAIIRTQRTQGFEFDFSPQDDTGSQARTAGGNGRRGGDQGGQQSGRQGGGRGPQVTDEQCAQVTSALASRPDIQKQIDDARTAMRSQDADRQALQATIQKAYQDAGVDAAVAGACQRRTVGGTRGQGRSGRGGQGRGGAGRGAGRGGRGGGNGSLGGLGRNPGGASGRMLPTEGVVYVQTGIDSTAKPPKPKFEPRFVRIGIQDFDNVEIVSGLRPGERVALLAQAVLQQQRDDAAARRAQMQRNNMIPGANVGERGGRGGGSRGGRGN